MALTMAEVRRAAARARIALDAPRLSRLAREIDAILTHIDTLPDVDCDPEPPNLVDAGPATTLRDDGGGADPLVLTPSAMAPEWRDGFFVVPRLSFADAAEGEADA